MNLLSPTLTAGPADHTVVTTFGLAMLLSSAAMAQSSQTDSGAESRWLVHLKNNMPPEVAQLSIKRLVKENILLGPIHNALFPKLFQLKGSVGESSPS